MKETMIERHLRLGVEMIGGMCLKYSSGSKAGFPDRLCLLPGGVTFWVELKAPGEKPRQLQNVRMDSLKNLGHRVYVADTYEAVDRIIAEYR